MVGTLGIVMAISNNGLVSYQQKSVLGCVICAILGSLLIVIVVSVSGDDMCELLSLPSLQLTLLSIFQISVIIRRVTAGSYPCDAPI